MSIVNGKRSGSNRSYSCNYEENPKEPDDDYENEEEDEYEDDYDEYEGNNTDSVLINNSSNKLVSSQSNLSFKKLPRYRNSENLDLPDSNEPKNINKRKMRQSTENNRSFIKNEDTPASTGNTSFCFEMYEKTDIIQVNCNSIIGELHKKKFGSGGKGSCIRLVTDPRAPVNLEVNDDIKVEAEKWMTPIEFESFCDKGHCRDWKRTIKAGGQSLAVLMEHEVLVCHAISCCCAACNKNESLVGPFIPFTRYRRRKKDEILAQNAFKKFLSLKPPTLLQDSLQKIQSGNSKSCYGGCSSIVSGSNSNIEQNSALASDLGRAGVEKILNNKEIIRTGLENQKEFAACLEEFEESEESKWSLLEQECSRMISQAQLLQQVIQKTRKESEYSRNILIKKFFNNS